MTKDEIIKMAQESWLFPEAHIPNILEFANLVAAAEREAIAQMIEDAPPLVDFAKNEQDGCIVCGFTPKLAALTIRARGQG